MKWAVFNLLGAMAWLAGLTFAKGAQLPAASFFVTTDHQFMLGLAIGAAGLMTLLWVNFRSTT